MRLYKKIIPVRSHCGTIGNRADLCPTPSVKRCGPCGQEVGTTVDGDVNTSPPASSVRRTTSRALKSAQENSGESSGRNQNQPSPVLISDVQRARERQQQVCEYQPARKKHHRQNVTGALLPSAAVTSLLSEAAYTEARCGFPSKDKQGRQLGQGHLSLHSASCELNELG